MLVARGQDTTGAEHALLLHSMAEVKARPNPNPNPNRNRNRNRNLNRNRNRNPNANPNPDQVKDFAGANLPLADLPPVRVLEALGG